MIKTANFDFYAPTKVVFGKGSVDRLGALVKAQGCSKVLIHYGGKSALKSGLIDRVRAALDAEGIGHVSLGGVVPNPHLGLVYEGIELGKKEGVDFILAVGGGSAKRISPPWSTPSAGVTGAREVSPVLSPSARKTAKRSTA